MSNKLEMLNAAISRVKDLEFGEPITNICAGSINPRRHSFFCNYVLKQRKNKYGIVHKEHYAKCTDKKGVFWETDVEVIFKGHLNDEKCKELFAPIWQAKFGDKL